MVDGFGWGIGDFYGKKSFKGNNFNVLKGVSDRKIETPWNKLRDLSFSLTY